MRSNEFWNRQFAVSSSSKSGVYDSFECLHKLVTIVVISSSIGEELTKIVTHAFGRIDLYLREQGVSIQIIWSMTSDLVFLIGPGESKMEMEVQRQS
jgi:hypothetical protein